MFSESSKALSAICLVAKTLQLLATITPLLKRTRQYQTLRGDLIISIQLFLILWGFIVFSYSTIYRIYAPTKNLFQDLAQLRNYLNLILRMVISFERHWI